MFRPFHIAGLDVSHPSATLTGNCGPAPGVACRLVWDVSHNGQAAQITSGFLGGPVHLLVRLVFVALLALVARALAHRVIRKVTERAAYGFFPQFGDAAAASRSGPGTLMRHPLRSLRRRRHRPRPSRPGDPSPAADEPSPPGTVIAERVAEMEHALVDERRHQRVRALGSVLRSAASIGIFGIAGAVILADLGIDLAPLLASAGVVGVALGFGAQNLVRDYLSGIFMLLEDQFGVGDSISIGEVSGTVESVTLRITRLRDTKGVVWHIRNGTIEQVGNQSQGWARAVIDYPVPGDGDLAIIRNLLEDAAAGLWNEAEWRSVMLAAPEVWGAQEVSSRSVTMRTVVKTAPLRQWSVERELRARYHAALDAAGIHFPPSSAGD